MTDEEKARFETNAVFLCREISKETGQIAVYELDVPVDGHMIFCLRIRQQFNPELRYFVVGEKFYTAHKQEIIASLNKPRRKTFPEYFKKSLGLQVKQKQAARRKAALEAKKEAATKKQ